MINISIEVEGSKALQRGIAEFGKDAKKAAYRAINLAVRKGDTRMLKMISEETGLSSAQIRKLKYIDSKANSNRLSAARVYKHKNIRPDHLGRRGKVVATGGGVRVQRGVKSVYLDKSFQVKKTASRFKGKVFTRTSDKAKPVYLPIIGQVRPKNTRDKRIKQLVEILTIREYNRQIELIIQKGWS